MSPSPPPAAKETAGPLVEEAVRRFCKAWHDMMLDNERCLARNAYRSHRGGGNALLIGEVYCPDDESTDVTLMDPRSGEVVRRMGGLSGPGFHVCAGGGMLCVVSAVRGVLRLVDAATDGVADLLLGPTTATAKNVYSGYKLGHVSSTGEHKLLHVYNSRDQLHYSSEILTVAGAAAGHAGGEWRATGTPPLMRVEHTIPRGSATVDGVVYFLSHASSDRVTDRHGRVVASDSIAAFDLATEQWIPALLQGPLTQFNNYPCRDRRNIALAALAGRLVLVHHNYPTKTIDLYAMTTPPPSNTLSSTWTNTHSLPLTTILRGWDKASYGAAKPMKPGGGFPKRRSTVVLPTREEVKAAIEANYRELVAQPLTVLEDGRIAVWARGNEGAVRLHDPKTGVCVQVAEVERCGTILGVYTGCA